MLIKSKDRMRKMGEVFTPAPLVKEMLDNISKQVWKDKTKTFIDPACGNGNFLVEVVKRKIKAGSNKWQALSTTYGVDIMEDNVLECRERLLQVADVKQKRFRTLIEQRVVCGDTLKDNLEDLFK